MMVFVHAGRATDLLKRKQGRTGERINAGLGLLTSALPKRVTKCHQKLIITFYLSSVLHKAQ